MSAVNYFFTPIYRNITINMTYYPQIQALVNDIIQSPPKLSQERMALLEELGDYIRGRHEAGDHVRLNFICTHNSRRSHLGQIWAQVWASHFGLEDFESYSGGTEVTAFHPNAISALRNQGFEIQGDQSPNPHYEVKFGAETPIVECWSKVYSDRSNPATDFAAVMVCDSAEEACPFVAGAQKRLGITYIDPKVSDGTPEQDATYRERSLQIGAELYLAFQHATT